MKAIVAARDQHAVELRHRPVQPGEVVEHRMADHEVERRVGERQRLGVDLRRLDLEAELVRGRLPGGAACRARCPSRSPGRSRPARSRLSVK